VPDAVLAGILQIRVTGGFRAAAIIADAPGSGVGGESEPEAER
jgi:hypothetical protein